MKFGKKILLAALFCTMIGLELSAVDNAVTCPEEPQGYENYWNCVSRKLGRGISNAALGALEIPIRIFQVQFEEGGIAAVTYGTLNGIGYFIGREVLGVLDIATFFMPLPWTPNDPVNGEGWGFGPVFTPEWILSPDTDPYNTVYKDSGFQN